MHHHHQVKLNFNMLSCLEQNEEFDLQGGAPELELHGQTWTLKKETMIDTVTKCQERDFDEDISFLEEQGGNQLFSYLTTFQDKSKSSKILVLQWTKVLKQNLLEIEPCNGVLTSLPPDHPRLSVNLF